MGISWFKKLFKRNKKKETTTSEVATLDTSLLKVPKFNQLNDEAKKEVLELFRGINYDNYDSILKYSETILNKSNIELEILIKTMSRYDNEFTKINNYATKGPHLEEKIINFILSSHEYQLIIKDILDTRRALELRLIALDMFIKKESLRRLDFLGIAGRDERIKYLNHKMRLDSEKDRLRTMIKTNDNIFTAVCRDVAATNSIRKELAIQGNNSSLQERIRRKLGSYLTLRCHYLPTGEVSRGFDEVVIKVIKQFEGCTDVNGKTIDEKRIKEYIKEGTEYWEDSNWDKPAMEMPQEFINVLFQEIANYYHNVEIYTYEHKDDYKVIIEEMKSICDDLEKKPSKEWNFNELQETVLNYCKKVANYWRLCKKYLNKKIKMSLIYNLYDLMYYRNLAMQSNNAYNYKKKEDIFWDHYFLHDGDVDRFDVEKYCRLKTWRMLRRVENMYGIEAKELRNYILATNRNVNDMDDVCDDEFMEIRIRNDYDNFSDLDKNLAAFGSTIHDLEIVAIDDIEVDYNNEDTNFYKSYSRTDSFYYAYLEDKSNQSLEDVFYTFKFTGAHDDPLLDDSLEIHSNPVNEDLFLDNYLLPTFIKEIKNSILEKNYDERITVIPKAIQFYNSPLEKHSSLVIAGGHYIRNINEIPHTNRTEAIYVSTVDQFIEILKRSNDKTEMKYLIVEESICNDGIQEYIARRIGRKELERINSKQQVNKETLNAYYIATTIIYSLFNNRRHLKLIVVPNGTKYYELSEYLDKEIEKDKKEEQVLKKTS